MPDSETRRAAAERRHAEMTEPLRDAFPLPPPDARFAALLDKLRDIRPPVGRPPAG